MPGRVYVISGPSGVGKSTIIKQTMKRVKGLRYSVSHTSRKSRDKEVDGVHYHFVSQDDFKKMIDEGAFVEWARVYQDLYGTSQAGLRKQLRYGQDVILDLDSQGARNVKQHFEDAILAYIFPPSFEDLEKRLKGRGTDTEEVIHSRMEAACNELRVDAVYDYIILNENLDESVGELEAIIVSNRCTRSRRLERVNSIINQAFKN